LHGGDPISTDDQLCFRCASSETGGQLSFRKETRKPGGAWLSTVATAPYDLCGKCYEWASQLMQHAGDSGSLPDTVLGFPIGGEKTLSDEAHCSYCHGFFGREAIGVDLVPSGREFVRTSLFRRVGEIRQQRICRQCEAWWVSTLADSSAVTGTSFRKAEGGMGGWLTTVAADAAGLFLLKRDAYVLQSTIQGMERDYYALTASHLAEMERWEAQPVLFISAGKRDRATLAVRRLSPAVRARTVITARHDCMVDALGAMHAGARDILASPISAQQVSGALDRVFDPALPGERDANTGLPIFRTEHLGPRYHLPCDPVSLVLRPTDDVPSLILLLRRFLRGYDRVGVDAQGRLMALVYVAPQDAASVFTRLATVLGERVLLEGAVPSAAHLQPVA